MKNEIYGSMYDLDEVKSKFSEDFLKLREIVNNHDPIGLIEIGCPIDEYDPEVKTIIVKLDLAKTEEDIHNLIFNEFTEWFGDMVKKENLSKMANDIYKWKNK